MQGIFYSGVVKGVRFRLGTGHTHNEKISDVGDSRKFPCKPLDGLLFISPLRLPFPVHRFFEVADEVVSLRSLVASSGTELPSIVAGVRLVQAAREVL